MNLTPEYHLRLSPDWKVPGLLSLVGSNPYWLGMTMFRMQEFYESKYPDIRGQVFAMERAMDLYAAESGFFDYPDKWRGFNVPGHVIDEFFARFRGDLSEKEIHLRGLIQRERRTDLYYLIGTVVGSVAGFHRHERAHAAFYLDQTYCGAATKLVEEIPSRTKEIVQNWLVREGYGENVLTDEIHAYLSTNTPAENKENFGSDPECAGVFRQFHKNYFGKLKT